MPQADHTIAIYSRKSRYTGKGESIGNQVDLCRAYIQTSYGASAAESAFVFEDEGFSGGNLNRPDFKRMMKAAQAKKFDTLIVYRLDRISRNISDFSQLIEELSRLNISFISIRENFDTSSPMGRAMMYIASVFSQLERETIAERIRDNLHELAKTGRWLGGVPPTGYTSESVKSITVDGKTKRSCKLKLIPEQAQTIAAIYDLYTKSNSLSETETQLIRRNIKTKNGRNFTRFSIKSILQNPVYLIADEKAYHYFTNKNTELFSDCKAFDGIHGILAYNRTLQQKGHSTVYLPIDQWIVSVGQHPGIIPSDKWIYTQALLEQHRSHPAGISRGNSALLSGLLFCICGSPMYPKTSNRILPNGASAFYYICKQKDKSKQTLCRTRNINGNLLDASVLSQIASLVSDMVSFSELLQKSKPGYQSGKDQAQHTLDALYKERALVLDKTNALIDSLASFQDSSALSSIKNRIEQLHTQSEELNQRIQALQASFTQSTLSPHRFDELRRLFSSFSCCIHEMDAMQKRSALQSLSQKIIWDGQYAHLFLQGSNELPFLKNESPAALES